MAIVIKKRVSLEFLGDEYKEAYLVFKSIPAIDYDSVIVELNKFQENQGQSLTFLIELLQKYFLDGKFPDDDGKLEPVVSSDLGQLDPNTIIKCFQVFTGQELDPKVEMPLSTPSSTEPNPPENT